MVSVVVGGLGGWPTAGDPQGVHPPAAHSWPARANPALNGEAYARKIPVKANLDARAADPAVPLLARDVYELRRAWNQANDQVAPWWRWSSKEVYASGIADLMTTLGNWSDAKAGRRAGRPVGSPALRPTAATVAGSAAPPARCVLSPTDATSSCR